VRLTINKGDGYLCYPFKGPVPVRLVSAEAFYLVLEVLPHANEEGFRSTPYTITVDRWDLETGRAKLEML